MNRRQRFFSIIAVLLFVLPAFAQQADSILFTQSIEFYQKGDFEDSAKILENLVKKNPQKSLYWFNLGNTNAMLKKYDRAVGSYKKVIALNGNLAPAAKLYAAKALKSQGRTEDASSLLRELLQEDPPSGIRAEAEQDLASLESGNLDEENALVAYQKGDYGGAAKILQSRPPSEISVNGQILLSLSLIRQNRNYEAEGILQNLAAKSDLSVEDKATVQATLSLIRRNETAIHPYWLFLDLAAGATNNAYLDGKSVVPVSSSLLVATIGTGYHFNKGETWSEKIAYLLNYENPLNATDLQTVIHTLQVPVIYRKKELDLSLTPYFQEQVWSGTQVSNKVGITSKNAFMSGHYEAGLDADVSSQKAMDSDYSYLGGASYLLRPYFGGWGSSFYAQVFWLFGRDGTQDILYADGSLLPMMQNYQGPGARVLWKQSAHSTWDFNLNWIHRNYDHAALPENTSRADSQLEAFLKYSYALSAKISIYGSGDYIANSSTLGSGDVRDKNYNAYIFLVGMNWDVFQ